MSIKTNNLIWLERIDLMLVDPRTKEEFLKSVRDQITNNLWNLNLPTKNQLRLLELWWESYEEKQVLKIIGGE